MTETPSSTTIKTMYTIQAGVCFSFMKRSPCYINFSVTTVVDNTLASSLPKSNTLEKNILIGSLPVLYRVGAASQSVS